MILCQGKIKIFTRGLNETINIEENAYATIFTVFPNPFIV